MSRDIDLKNLTSGELDEAWLSLSDARKYVVEIMHFSEDDLRQGLVAGVVKAVGKPDGQGGYREVEVQCGGLVRWIATLLEERFGPYPGRQP